ncbi:MAG TPA: aminotransferase class V-fold PLP-dependent enzyme [Usitatibacteraceae bacterium]|nr:aminotransferase class V-fold PLP-dependent enzyme [Usitatibacteraceae bacterium]
MDDKRVMPETSAAQALGWIDQVTGAISPPLHLSSTFLRDADNQYRRGHAYARDENPAFDQLEALLGALEKGRHAAVFASGMAAATAAFMALKPGNHVVAPKVMYWALRNWLMQYATLWGLQVEFIDMSSTEELKRAVRVGKTRLVWVETPANPLWTISDIAACAEIAHTAGALLAVDSTAATPVLTRPLALGADLVMHSATKYLNGHSDLIAGALVAREDSDYWQRVKQVRASQGATLGSFESWLLMRGMRTLYLRVHAACRSASMLAEFLDEHELVEEVLYPGLPQFPGHAIAANQMQGGFGGMLSIRVRGGTSAAIATAAGVEVWKRATSLGGVESLLEHRASVEGPGSPAPDDLLRLSVGIENVDDLIDDLDEALIRAHRS